MKLKLLFLPLAIVGSLFIFIYFTKPAWDDYSESKTDLSESVEELTKITTNDYSIKSAMEIFSQIDSENKILLKNSMPTSLDEDNFLQELNNLTLESGTRLTELELAKVDKFESDEIEVSDSNGIDVTIVSLSMAGNYFGLKKSLYSIENMNRFAKVNELSISTNAKTNSLVMSLDLEIYSKEKTDSRFNANSKYFKSLLVNGLRVDVANTYKEYRDEVIDFDLIEVGAVGKEDLFSGAGAAVEVEEIASDDEEEDSSENIETDTTSESDTAAEEETVNDVVAEEEAV